MSAIILKGSAVAENICEGLKKRCAALNDRGQYPCLAILRVGERPDDLSYENAAVKRCGEIGIEVKKIVLPDMIAQKKVERTVREMNADRDIHGILIFRPLPRHLDERAVCELLSPEKDVDGICSRSMATVYSGMGAGFSPCTAQAVLELLKFYNIPISGRRVAIVGRSLVIGRPVSMLLMRENATVTICHSATEELPAVTREADIIVAAAGCMGFLRAEHFSPGQTVIDVGINMDMSSGKIVGDVDFSAAEQTVYALSPVPGGVGAVTTSVLALHIIEAAERP